MATKTKLDGLAETTQRLNEEISEIPGRTRAGLMAAGMIIQAEAQNRVPVEYGNLRASAYTQVTPENPDTVEVGFTASYALDVHENMEQKLKGKPRPSGLGVYWGPHGQPKYLESAMNDKSQEVLDTVAAYADVEQSRGRG